MHGVHFGRRANPLKIVFLHANGMNGLSYRTLLEPTGHHCLALDLRGFGATHLPTDAKRLSGFQTFSNDVVKVLATLSGPVVLAGHSLGASVAVLTAAQRPDLVKACVAFDPIVLSRLTRRVMTFGPARTYLKKRMTIARKTAAKRSVFPDRKTALSHYVGRGVFKKLPAEVTRDFVMGGFRDRDDGQVELACAPLWEQAVYVSQSHDLAGAIRHLPRDSSIIATNYFGNGRRVARAVRGLNGVNFDNRADLDHFFPLIEPEECAALLHATVQATALR